jgi:CRISPR system Cascade subunit CasA
MLSDLIRLLRSSVLISMVGSLLAGCIVYRPHPVDLAAYPARYAARRLDAAEVQQAIASRRPQHAAHWPLDSWDRMDLFIASQVFNPKLAEARAAVFVARAGRKTAREYPNPSIGLMAEYAKAQSGETSPWLLGFTSDVPLDIGTRRSARIALADIAADQASMDYAEVLWTVYSQLNHAFVDYLLTAREIEILAAISTDRDELVRLLERRLALGAADRSEVIRAQIERGAEQQRLADARRREFAARATLAESIGVPPQALAGLRLEASDIESPNMPKVIEFSEWKAQAFLVRSDLRHAVADYDAAEQSLRLEVARQYPEVRVGPGYTWERGLVKLPFVLSVSLPIFNQNHGAIAAAEARRVQAAQHLDVVQTSIASATEQAETELVASLQRLSETRAGQFSAALALEWRARKAVRLGAADRSDLIMARLARRSSELAALDALRQVQLAVAATEDSLRRPLFESGNTSATLSTIPPADTKTPSAPRPHSSGTRLPAAPIRRGHP